MAEIQQILGNTHTTRQARTDCGAEGGVALNWESPYGETALLVAVAAVQTPAVQVTPTAGCAHLELKFGGSC